MPGGDRTGPAGEGPMTGRGAGLCGGYSSPGYASSPGRGGHFMSGRGGRGRGGRNQFCFTGMNAGGRGFQNFNAYGRRGFYRQSDFSADLELRMLKEQAESMQNEVLSVNERIKELESILAGQKEQS